MVKTPFCPQVFEWFEASELTIFHKAPILSPCCHGFAGGGYLALAPQAALVEWETLFCLRRPVEGCITVATLRIFDGF